jgi:hypothetical protein
MSQESSLSVNAVRQLLMNCISLLKNVQNEMDITLFRRLFTPANAASVNGLWQQSDHNVLEFYKGLQPAQKSVLETYLSKYIKGSKTQDGETETKHQSALQHVESAYRIVAIMYKKFLEQVGSVPVDLQNLWEKIKKDNMVYFVSILGDSLLDQLLDWSDNHFEISEFLHLSPNRPYPVANMAKVYQLRGNINSSGDPPLLLPVRSTRNKVGGKPRMAMFPGSSSVPSSRVNHSIRNVSNHSNPVPQSTQNGGVRSFAQLQKAFGEI